MAKLDRFNAGLEIKFASGNDAKVGTFTGYGAVFGNIDSYGDTIKKGAFKEDLKDWGKKGRYPPMLLQHGGGMFGSNADDLVPIGKWTQMKEDDVGLAVEGELFGLSTQRGTYIYEGMKAGALDGLSIGYVAREVEYNEEAKEPYRTLKRVDLHEVSLVTFPANGAARIESVKSEDFTERDFEHVLYRQLGFTRAEAKTIVSKGYRALRGARDAADPVVDEISRILGGTRDAVAPEVDFDLSGLLAILK